jgi:hypothetical protein
MFGVLSNESKTSQAIHSGVRSNVYRR